MHQHSARDAVTEVRPRCDVLHVTEAFGGGVETVLRQYLAAVPELDHMIVARTRANFAISNGPELPILSTSGGPAHLMWLAIRAIREHRPTVVHLHSSVAGLLRLAPVTSRVLYQPHCFAFERTDCGPVKVRFIKEVERLLAARTHTFVAVSAHEAKLAYQLRRGVRAVLVPNAAPVVDANTSPPTSRSAITVGRITQQKDPAFFAATADRLRRVGVSTTWVGDGDEAQKLALRSAGVEVTGWLPQADVAARLRGSELYIHTAAWEGAPLAILEAAASGLPVLSRRIPSVESMGFPTAPIDGPDGLAAAVVTFFDSEAYRQEVNERTQRALESFTVERQRQALENLYGL